MACVLSEHAGDQDLVASNTLAAAFADGFPLTPGNTLIVPRRHEPDFLALSSAEQGAIWALVPDVCRHIEARYRSGGPDQPPAAIPLRRPAEMDYLPHGFPIPVGAFLEAALP